jgi:threonine 3-dehydrogenase
MTTNILITGASGEIGSSLVEYFSEQGSFNIVGIDPSPAPSHIQSKCHRFIQGSILEEAPFKAASDISFDKIFHMAGILSSGCERNPVLGHQVNVQGTFNTLEFARKQSVEAGRAVMVMYPSTIAVYGIPTLADKTAAGKIQEDQFLNANILYAHSKIYAEKLGVYFTKYYQMLADKPTQKIDFRCVRFPGIWSATTLPTGGTTDYAPEMIHAAAQGHPYKCFVRPDTTLPFMTMPDALKALIQISEVKAERIKSRIYNVGAFSMSAEDIATNVKRYFPNASTSYEPHLQRQSFVDMWPADVDDSKARSEWGWEPQHGKIHAFEEYMIPAVKSRYPQTSPATSLSR